MNFLTETRAWLGTWSGKLSAAAGIIAAPLANNAVVTAGLADYIPYGLPRLVFLAVIVLASIFGPKAAAKKDAALAE